MNREKLIAQVKDEYARLADEGSQPHIIQTTGDVTAEHYYEKLLNIVEKEIASGTFDSFHSGREIVEAVANDKHKWLSHDSSDTHSVYK